MPRHTTTAKYKATTNPRFSRLRQHPTRIGVGLFSDTHTHIYAYLLTCSGHTRGPSLQLTLSNHSVQWIAEHTSSITYCHIPGFYTGKKLYCSVTEVQGVNNLSKVVTKKCNRQEFDQQALNCYSNDPTMAPHARYIYAN